MEGFRKETLLPYVLGRVPCGCSMEHGLEEGGHGSGGPGAEAAAEAQGEMVVAWMEALEVGRRGRLNSKRRDRNDKAEKVGEGTEWMNPGF